MRVTTGLIVKGLWVVFVLVWLAAAPFSKRTVRRRTYAPMAILSLVLIAVAIVADRLLRSSHLQALHPFPHSAAVQIGCVAVEVAGLALSFWARWAIGRNWSGDVTIKQDHELVTTGPYALVRHPIYAGIVVMMAATVVFVDRIEALIGLCLLGIALWFKLRQEEALMTQQFGERYLAYKERVKAIIPGVL